jgi:hypothetical protein
MEEKTYPVHLVGDVAQHDGSADIAAVKDALTADTVVLVSWMTLVWTVEGADSRAVADKAALVIDARLRVVRRVHGSLARPRGRLSDSPTEGLLRRCQYIALMSDGVEDKPRC